MDEWRKALGWTWFAVAAVGAGWTVCGFVSSPAVNGLAFIVAASVVAVASVKTRAARRQG